LPINAEIEENSTKKIELGVLRVTMQVPGAKALGAMTLRNRSAVN